MIQIYSGVLALSWVYYGSYSHRDCIDIVLTCLVKSSIHKTGPWLWMKLYCTCMIVLKLIREPESHTMKHYLNVFQV